MLHTWSHHPGTLPLVLLHGYTGSVASWDRVAKGLAHDCTVLGAELPGHADTAPPIFGGFDANVEAVVAAITSVGLRQVNLAGYSLGARIALGIAVRHPELVARMTLFGVNPGLENEAERQARAAGDHLWIELLRDQGIGAFVQAWERQPLFGSQVRHLSSADRTHQHQRRLQHNAQALAHSLETTGLSAMPNYWLALPDIHLPVHLVAGADDSKFSRIATRAQALLPEARLTLLPDCGHNPIIEAPSAVVQLLRHEIVAMRDTQVAV